MVFCSEWVLKFGILSYIFYAIFQAVKMNFGSKFGFAYIFPYRFLEILQISRKSGADSCIFSLLASSYQNQGENVDEVVNPFHPIEPLASPCKNSVNYENL